MKYVEFPFAETERLSFYLATEEYLALNYPKAEYFFMWQVRPTVIFGRNQLIENEVNLDFVKRNNIEYYRRKSGGGCVYADMSNIMFSFITPTFNRDFVFDNYLNKVVSVLQSLGVPAEFSGRNDILVEGHKVSGNAFYRVNDRSVVHGTMLFDTDLSIMVKAITPDNEKLISKGIDSVRKRVTNLKEYLDISIEEFKAYFREHMADETLQLSESDVEGIKKIEKTYLTLDFIYGKNPNYTLVRKGRVEAGSFEISLELKNNVVKKLNMLGDFFIIGDESELLEKFKNIEFTKAKFQEKLSGVKLDDYIYNLKAADFLGILFEE
ncbi:MAG: lipoate--protein ligase [Bacilli bacterium]|nr:lipoate--protein ligase [Bacilli bacterium]